MKQHFVEVVVAVVEAELALFEVQIEVVRVHAAESREPGLGIAPEAFDPVDVVALHAAAAELVGAVIDPKVLLVPHVHQSVVPRPAVGMDDAADVNMPPYCRTERGPGAVGDDLGVHVTVAFVDAKDGVLRAAPRPRRPFTRRGPK